MLNKKNCPYIAREKEYNKQIELKGSPRPQTRSQTFLCTTRYVSIINHRNSRMKSKIDLFDMIEV